MNPGRTVRPLSSTSRVPGVRTSAFEPMATMRPSEIAMASARGRPAAMVRMLPLYRTRSGALRIMSHDLPVVHDEAQVAQVRDARRRIAIDRDQVGQLARFDRPLATRHAEPFGGLERG